MIAIDHIQLAAPVLGLGTTITSTFNTASQAYPSLIEFLELPEGNLPYGKFLIGYPIEKFQRIPVRKPVDVTWR
jgi:nitroreductase